MKQKDPLPRFRPDKGKALRFALLDFIKPKRAFTHYIDKKGTFRCLSTPEAEGPCCAAAIQAAALTIVALVVKYTNCSPVSGKYEGKYKVPDIEYELGYVNLSRKNYTDINKMTEDGEDDAPTNETVYDFDIIMTHNEATQIGYSLNRASRAPRWRKSPEIVAEITEAAQPFLDGKLLTSKLGRKLNPIEWKALLSTLNGEPDDDAASDDKDL
jgi:hypothetical protein